ncbi:hypothetical protein CEP54_005496 [Fusarium duplospermum]|uniref:Protein kinase domain-containing protein n=1 Tax=Fusarium duplospermum TaxID=1325734 RepID=A0A428QCA7_9HYPO|nr:hypothetical protein CEP54_005496 [Fusarium duplospermum]
MLGTISLRRAGLTQDSIWGDKSNTLVYAQVLSTPYPYGRAIIFRFYRNPQHSPKSLANRVVSCYHNTNVHDDTLSFRDRDAMRSAIWSSIATIWHRCAKDLHVYTPGTVIDLSSDDSDGLVWCAYRSPLFDQYLDLLRHIQKSDLVPRTSRSTTMDVTKITLLEPMGGRGCAKRANVYGLWNQEYFFFKGVDFATYLQHHDDENELIRAVVETWRRSSKLIANMPPHPNIQPPAEILVSIDDSKGEKVLMGHLSTFLDLRDLASLIEKQNLAGKQISLREKVKWCHQMSLVVAHTHRSLHTFHMDIQPGNFLVDSERNLVLIDWEQSGTSTTTLAPEADGTWDVNEEPTTKDTRLVYTKYTGPPRRNMPKDGGTATFQAWNVFPEWQATLHRATELAEVFALGRTMWMVLTQTVDGFDEVKHPNDVRVTWDSENDIPKNWIETVNRCMAEDPNERPNVEDLVKFWYVEQTLMTCNA